MKKIKFSPNNCVVIAMFKTYILPFSCLLNIALTQVSHADVQLNDVFSLATHCESTHLQDFFACGTISGRLNTLYYSTHDAYFVKNLNQDTATTGGFIQYQTYPIANMRATVSYAGQWRLDDQTPDQNEVSELKEQKDGLAEAYIEWKNPQTQIRIGQQALDVPFLGNYDWRIMPVLYQAVDAKYQYSQQDDVIRATAVKRYKSYAEDQFSRSSRYSHDIKTDGMWSLGIAKHFERDQQQLKGQFWYQHYTDYSHLLYAEGHSQWKDAPYQPDLALQVMWAEAQGDQLAGNVNHLGFGLSITLTILDQKTLKTAYNYIHPNKNSYLNGALFTPYMIYTASGPYFAQPFFTSTQDLGAGHAAMIAFEGSLNAQTYLGAQYSFMNLKESADIKALNQAEYAMYAIYNFSGALKGWSLSNFAGFATSPRSDDLFLQNRLGVHYTF